MMSWELVGGLDAILHVLFAILALLIVYPNWKRNLHWIIIFAVLMEIITDGSHIVNKSITHNIFFFIEAPLFILFAGYVLKDSRLGQISMLLLSTNLTHLLMDLFYEGDSIQMYYPVLSTWYSVPPSYAGFQVGFPILLILLFPIAIASRNMGVDSTPPPVPPPYPT